MKKNNLINRSRFLLKSIVVACFFLFTQAVVSKAQVPYAQLTFNFDYTNYGSNTSYWKVNLYYYENDNDGNYISDPNVLVNVRTMTRLNCGPRVVLQEFTGISLSLIEAGNLGVPYEELTYNSSTSEYDRKLFWLELMPGTGYQIGSENFIGGPTHYCPN